MHNDIEFFLAKQPFKKLAWLIGQLEGFRAKTYYDLVGKATIGYGHEILKPDEGLDFLNLNLSQLAEGLTEELAHRLLAHDIMNRSNIDIFNINNLLDHHWIALTSFCFNIGTHHFKDSDTLKFMREGKLYEAADALCSWRECNKVFSEGIAKRRLCEMFILLQKTVHLESSLTLTQQLGSPYTMRFAEENWSKLNHIHRQEILNICKQFNI